MSVHQWTHAAQPTAALAPLSSLDTHTHNNGTAHDTHSRGTPYTTICCNFHLSRSTMQPHSTPPSRHAVSIICIYLLLLHWHEGTLSPASTHSLLPLLLHQLMPLSSWCCQPTSYHKKCGFNPKPDPNPPSHRWWWCGVCFLRHAYKRVSKYKTSTSRATYERSFTWGPGTPQLPYPRLDASSFRRQKSDSSGRAIT